MTRQSDTKDHDETIRHKDHNESVRHKNREWTNWHKDEKETINVTVHALTTRQKVQEQTITLKEVISFGPYPSGSFLFALLYREARNSKKVVDQCSAYFSG
ncbi:hypothetical protein RRG08_060195 [Elysia crispata]|uniref:Uncharacterized protein n=1 Tax=Elysia crispata TaxID=231223 RepID=A0AAE0ZYZ4_9GAST|nr:hypothetical protein RRG08_060195 [Elysia crispata]